MGCHGDWGGEAAVTEHPPRRTPELPHTPLLRGQVGGGGAPPEIRTQLASFWESELSLFVPPETFQGP